MVRAVVVPLLLFIGCAPPVEPPDLREFSLLVVEPAADGPSFGAAEVWPTPDSDTVRTEPVVVAVGDEGRSAEIELYVPIGVASVQLIASVDESVSVIIDRLVSPDGNVVVDNETPTDLEEGAGSYSRGFPAAWFSPNRVVATAGGGTFTLPSSPDVPFSPGLWRLWMRTAERSRVGDDWVTTPVTTGTVELVAIAVPPRPALVRVPLALFEPQQSSLGLPSWEENEPLVEALGEAHRIWAQVGVDLRVASAAALPVGTPDLTVVDLEDTCDRGEADDLFGAVEPRDGLPIHFIDGFSCVLPSGADVGQGIAGFAGGLPSPAWTRSAQTGVAVSTTMLDAPLILGQVLAHEIGHALGLFHAKEDDRFGNPSVYDPISDTAEGSDVAENLMYYAINNETELSDGQGFVVRHSPWASPSE